MKILRYIAYLLCLIITQACYDIDIEIGSGAPNKYGVIQGSITDQDGSPLERIKISISSEETESSSASYTSSDGRFRC